MEKHTLELRGWLDANGKGTFEIARDATLLFEKAAFEGGTRSFKGNFTVSGEGTFTVGNGGGLTSEAGALVVNMTGTGKFVLDLAAIDGIDTNDVKGEIVNKGRAEWRAGILTGIFRHEGLGDANKLGITGTGTKEVSGGSVVNKGIVEHSVEAEFKDGVFKLKNSGTYNLRGKLSTNSGEIKNLTSGLT